jgi:hypothetical protein
MSIQLDPRIYLQVSFLFLVILYSGSCVHVYGYPVVPYKPMVHAIYPPNVIKPGTNVTIYANITDIYGKNETASLRYNDSYNIQQVYKHPHLVNGLAWNGTYATEIQTHPNDTVFYTLSFKDELGYSYTHSGTFRNYKSSKIPPVFADIEVENPVTTGERGTPILVPGQDAMVTVIISDSSGVKNANITYAVDNGPNITVPMHIGMQHIGDIFLQFYTITIGWVNFPPNSKINYFISSCDFAGNCQTSRKYDFKVMSHLPFPPSNNLNIRATFSDIDLSNMTARMNIVTTTYLHFTSIGVPVLTAISVDPRSYMNAEDPFFLVPVSHTNQSDLAGVNSTTGTLGLFGDPSLFPYDSYASALVIVIPLVGPVEVNSFNITFNPWYDNSVWATWVPGHSKPFLSSIRDTNLEFACDKFFGFDWCSPDSSVMIIPVSFTRNYTSYYSVVGPLIGIFYLLGAIFMLNSDQLSNRLVLALAVFALIFTLPQLVSVMKPPSSTPTLADNMIGSIILSTIAYTATSVVASAAISRRWALLWDLLVFLAVSATVLIFFLSQKYSADINMWIIPVILVGLGYGLFIRIVKTRGIQHVTR